MTLYLMQGPPGSGKTTKSKELAKEVDAVIYSTDDYFNEPGDMCDRDLVYVFRPEKLGENHRKNQERTYQALAEGKNVIIDNTNTQCWECKPYVEAAVALDIPVKFIRCDGRFQNTHGVPEEKVQQMRDRMEDLTLEKVLASVNPYEKKLNPVDMDIKAGKIKKFSSVEELISNLDDIENAKRELDNAALVIGKLNKVQSAKIIATRAHLGTRRKWCDVPYITHPMRCALIAALHKKPDALIAAMWLHDVIEDEGEEWAPLIEEHCGKEVLALVGELTFPTETKEWEGKSRALKNVIREKQMREMSPLAKIGKMIDSIDNFLDMGNAPKKLVEKTIYDGWRRYEILKDADEKLAQELKETLEKLEANHEEDL